MADAACSGPAAYRPRRARDSPLYRLAETHHETFKQVYDERFAGRYGSWRAEIERSLFAFLDCGVDERGFARVRCDACRRGFREALSCQTRSFCPGRCRAAPGGRCATCSARGCRIGAPSPGLARRDTIPYP